MAHGLILVVEDNDLERETILTLLRRSNYSATGAADIPGAIAALEHLSDEIAVVLCDLRLRGHSGVELLRQWKAVRPSTPFIFVTGVFEIAQVVEAMKLGAEDYITKPYNTAELLSRVAECIEAANEDSSGLDRLARNSREDTSTGWLSVPADATLEEVERMVMERALGRTGGNRTHAAESLGISVRTLQRKLKAWANANSDGRLPSNQR